MSGYIITQLHNMFARYRVDYELLQDLYKIRDFINTKIENLEENLKRM